MNIDIKPGWCAVPTCPSPVGCECVLAPGHAELCTAHLARELDLPADSAAGNVVAELLRRDYREAA